jgi:hypothetical protein
MDEEPRAVTQYGGSPEFRVPGDPQLTAEQSGSDEDDLRAGLSGLAGCCASLFLHMAAAFPLRLIRV